MDKIHGKAWKFGDKVTVEMPFSMRIEYTPDIADLGGAFYGPVLLGVENLKELRTLKINKNDLKKTFSPDPRESLRFYSNNLAFVPFYEIHGTSYSVYFKMDTTAVRRYRKK